MPTIPVLVYPFSRANGQDLHVKGIEILGNELKLNQYADDTNLFCADLASVEKALEIVDSYGTLAGLKLNPKKTKAIWLGKWENF